MRRRPWKTRRAAALVLALLALSACASAGVPDWVRQAASGTLPTYPLETDAVVLFDEGRIVVKDSGEIRGSYRMAYKILRPQGRGVAEVRQCYGSETRITSLKAWSITAQGAEYEVKEKEAVETGFDGGELFNDNRCKALTVPGADIGSIVAFEYERKERPFVLEDHWAFQGFRPVRLSRLILQLPSGWEHKIFWMNHAPVPPTSLGANTWAFELRDLPAIETESSMPPVTSLAARIGIKYFSPSGGARSWGELGTWAGTLILPRRQSSPAMQQKVAELTANAPNATAKIRALAGYVQREVRYVAIEIGIGGFQPHAAPDVFANRWGDCKDKATLLSAMLQLAGVESHLVLVNTQRGLINPEYPFVSFNHAILAITLPPGAPADGLHAVSDVPGVGRVLFFDPTDNTMEFGNLPGSEQANYGLVVTPAGGVLAKMPVVPAESNRMDRYFKLSVSPFGGLTGDVREVYTGAEAAYRRSVYQSMDATQRQKRLETYLSLFVPSSELSGLEFKDLDALDKPLTVTYSFSARNYAKNVGDLLLVRPRVLGAKGADTFEDQHKRERRYPVEFENLTLHTDHVEITLPRGYTADEIPEPLALDPGPVSYLSKVEIKDNVLRYDREYKIKDVSVGADRLQDLKKFYRQLAGEEQNAVVLKKQ